MRGRRRERLRAESRVHDTNLRSVGEQNRGQVGSTILFECPAQIPRSFLRSFSLWARQPAETSAELNVRLGTAEFFPGAQQAGATVRKRRREGNARAAQGTASGRESGTRYKPAIPSLSRTAVRWGPRFSSSAPPRSPAPSFDHFPFGPPFLGRVLRGCMALVWRGNG